MPAAERAADEYGSVYTGARAAMVFDVVASRQRRYESRVVEMVRDFRGTPQSRGLAALAEDGPVGDFGLRAGEADTMRSVAAGLNRYAAERGLGDDDGCRGWAEEVAPLAHAHCLDPYVGAVKGIGPALFAYARMRSGGNALKPDLRVRAVFRRLGFGVPANDHAVLVVAGAAAAELRVSLLVLDQLLWQADAG